MDGRRKRVFWKLFKSPFDATVNDPPSGGTFLVFENEIFSRQLQRSFREHQSPYFWNTPDF